MRLSLVTFGAWQQAIPTSFNRFLLSYSNPLWFICVDRNTRQNKRKSTNEEVIKEESLDDNAEKQEPKKQKIDNDEDNKENVEVKNGEKVWVSSLYHLKLIRYSLQGTSISGTCPAH